MTIPAGVWGEPPDLNPASKQVVYRFVLFDDLGRDDGGDLLEGVFGAHVVDAGAVASGAE